VQILTDSLVGVVDARVGADSVEGAIVEALCQELLGQPLPPVDHYLPDHVRVDCDDRRCHYVVDDYEQHLVKENRRVSFGQRRHHVPVYVTEHDVAGLDRTAQKKRERQESERDEFLV